MVVHESLPRGLPSIHSPSARLLISSFCFSTTPMEIGLRTSRALDLWEDLLSVSANRSLNWGRGPIVVGCVKGVRGQLLTPTNVLFCVDCCDGSSLLEVMFGGWNSSSFVLLEEGKRLFDSFGNFIFVFDTWVVGGHRCRHELMNGEDRHWDWALRLGDAVPRSIFNVPENIYF